MDNNLLTYLKFDYFLTTLQKAEEHIANIEMYFEDEREDKNFRILNSYLKDLENLPFFSPLQDKLQDFCDYFLIVDRMRKNLTNKLKLTEIQSDIQTCKNRGFNTEEFFEIEKKTNDLIEWYQNYDAIFENKNSFKLNEILYKFDSTVKTALFSEEKLINLISSPLNSYIDRQNMNNLIDLLEDFKTYKKQLQNKIKSIESLISIIKEGLNFNVSSYEFDYMFKRLEFDIKWLLIGIKLIKTYHKDYKTHLPESVEEIVEVMSQKKFSENETNGNSFEFLNKILTSYEDSDRLKSTEEYEILKDLLKKSEKWSEEAHEVQ